MIQCLATIVRRWQPVLRVVGGGAGIALFAAGCGDDQVLDPNPDPSAAPAVFAVNSLGETLSRILVAEGTVIADALPLGVSPQGIAVLPGGGEALVVSSLSNRVDVVDLDRLAVRRSIDVGSGANPYAVVVPSGGGAAYVSCFLTDEVVRIDLASGAIESRIPVGRGPEGLLLLADRDEVYVALTGYTNAGYGVGTVAVLSVAADTVRAQLVVGKNPQSIGRAPDGTVHVACTGDYAGESGRVFVIDPTVTAVVDSIAIGGSPVAVLVLADHFGLTAGYAGGLERYDPTTGVAEEMAALAGDTWFTALAYDSADSLLYVSDFDDSMVHVVDPWADVRVRSFRVGHGPVALALRR